MSLLIGGQMAWGSFLGACESVRRDEWLPRLRRVSRIESFHAPTDQRRNQTLRAAAHVAENSQFSNRYVYCAVLRRFFLPGSAISVERHSRRKTVWPAPGNQNVIWKPFSEGCCRCRCCCCCWHYPAWCRPNSLTRSITARSQSRHTPVPAVTWPSPAQSMACRSPTSGTRHLYSHLASRASPFPAASPRLGPVRFMG